MTGSYQTFANENHENVAQFSRPQHCSLCNTMSKHKESVEKIIRKAKDDPNWPKINSNDFKLKPMCTIKTHKGEKNYLSTTVRNPSKIMMQPLLFS